MREPSYPPTLIPSNPLYRQYFILDNVLLIKGSRKILLKMWQLYLLIHLKMSNERILTSIFDSFYPRCLEVTKMHYSLSRGYWDTTYIGKSYPLLKLWQFGRWTKKKKKIFVFFGTKFCCQKMTSLDFKNSYCSDLFFP